ncbi:MAG TPA: nucleotidyltransferase domain-containing protein [Candidatus Nanoarchaeia archaeon]|nr:nucleotidyltransferase domain-containing protein [Candidatus Nanoarchaeia archaeon]
MRKESLLTYKKKIILILKRNNVVKAGIFGSLAKGSFKKSSDIDILIKFKGQRSLFDLARLELELEEKLGRRVDVLTYRSLHPLIKKEVLKEEVKIL